MLKYIQMVVGSLKGLPIGFLLSTGPGRLTAFVKHKTSNGGLPGAALRELYGASMHITFLRT